MCAIPAAEGLSMRFAEPKIRKSEELDLPGRRRRRLSFTHPDLGETVEKLQKAVAWRKAVFEASNDAILVSDADGNFIDVNRAACTLTGYTRDELLAETAATLHREQNFPLLSELKNRILAGEEIRQESVLFTRDGREIEAEISYLLLDVGEASYIHTSVRDITARKRLESAFLQAQKMEAVGALAAGVAHDFNNLLTTIRGYAELLIEDLAPDDPMRSDIERIRQAGEQATSLTSQLLAFSRKQIPSPEVLDLNVAIDDISSVLRRVIGEDIELYTATQGSPAFIYADATQIQQIIMNLAVNARAAMPDGGKLTIETTLVELDEHDIVRSSREKPGSYVKMTVTDNRTETNDEEIRAGLFDSASTAKQSQETGLGIPVVRGIAKQNGGFIRADSRPGEGSTFEIYLPRAKRRASTDRSDTALQGSGTVLVVEDEPLVRELTCRILRESGYTVLEAADGIEAYNRAVEHRGEIELVLTDVVMPRMGGVRLVSKLQTARPGIKALFVSGYADRAVMYRGLPDSRVAVLQKPYAAERLLRMVKAAIAG